MIGVFMKNAVVLVLILVVTGTFSSAQTEQGAYVAAVLKNGSMIGQNSIIAGGRVGWMFSRSFSLGGAFYSLANNIESDKTDPLSGRKLLAGFNCGGLELELIYPSENFLHGSFLFFMGGGGIKPIARDKSIPHTSYYGQSILIWEPQFNLEVNLTQLLHLGLGLSYRFVTGVNGYIGLQNKNFSSLNSLITLRFGSH